MKQYFLKAAGVVTLLALLTAGAFAQQDNKENSTGETTVRHNDDIIIIRPKVNIDTKLTIEIKGEDVKVNGKPLSEYKNDDVSISRRKQMTIENNRIAELDAMDADRNRFRGGVNVYGYGDANNLRNTLNSNKAFLGVGTEKNEAGEGVTITSVTDESAAEKAGLKEGDIITKINDIKTGTPEELTKAIGKFNPDEKITVTYKRDKKEQKTTAVLTKRKNAGILTFAAPQFQEFKNFNWDNGSGYNFNWTGKPRLGLKAQETEDGKGLKVLDVDDESTAEKAGIKEGDIITSFDGTDVNTVGKLSELAKPAIDKGNFKIKLTRDGKQQEIDVKIPKKLKTTSL
ncbi:MAG: PDZ domain-containing protein [Chitinophagaceae bacterium]